MAILIDPIADHGKKGKWCHMVSDKSVSELHKFAQRVGLQRAWFQGKDPRHPHYDLRLPMRARALLLGAREVSGVELIKSQWALYGRPGTIQEEPHEPPPSTSSSERR